MSQVSSLAAWDGERAHDGKSSVVSAASMMFSYTFALPESCQCSPMSCAVKMSSTPARAAADVLVDAVHDVVIWIAAVDREHAANGSSM
jgi:hypothetical protein